MVAKKVPAKKTAPAKEFSKRDVYADVTNKIVAMLEKGTAPWRQSWNGTVGASMKPPIRANGVAYQGINVLLLWAEAQEKGYSERRWMTYKQAETLGAQVRKGEKGTLVVKAGKFLKDMDDPEKPGQTKKVAIPFMKGYTVFNVCQIEGLPEKYLEAKTIADETVSANERVEAAESFFNDLGADVRHGGVRAFYSPSQDYIQMPDFEAFHDSVAYYATRAHETVHWTKHEARLNREFGRKRWGDEGYAMEELVAELGAAFLAANLGLSAETPREDHASYLASWLKVLKNDTKAIFTASRHAQQACDFLYEATGRVVVEVKEEAEDEIPQQMAA